MNCTLPLIDRTRRQIGGPRPVRTLPLVAGRVEADALAGQPVAPRAADLLHVPAGGGAEAGEDDSEKKLTTAEGSTI